VFESESTGATDTTWVVWKDESQIYCTTQPSLNSTTIHHDCRSS
jgi:hypothetical protein